MLQNIQYKWKGIRQTGESASGIIEAQSLALAKANLRQQGIITRRIVIKRKSLLNHYSRNIKPSDITLFARQLATLIKAGLPLLQSFEIIRSGMSNPRMKMLIETIRADVGTGLMFAQALRKHPMLFNPLFCSMIHAGEQSGSLDVMLEKVAVYKENIARIKKKLRKAVVYPTTVTLIAIAVTCGLLTWVIPQFASLFNEFGAELPTLTRYVINISDFFKSWWLIIVSLIVFVIYGLIYTQKHSPRLSRRVNGLVLQLPLIGGIMQKASIARFTRTLSITFAAGLPLTDALTSVAGSTGNELYAQAAHTIREEISHGQSMQRAIQNTQLFPDLVIQLVSIGEESGALEHMLSKIADFYEEDVANAIDAFSGLLEPVIMTILGLLIGCMVVAMYLPILTLGSVV